MKKSVYSQKFEQGQIIVIVAVAMVALLALAALIIDGGAILVNRRAAQNAADAGALAGAQVMCSSGVRNDTEIEAAIQEYTVDINNASSFTWDFISPSDAGIDGLKLGEIEVTAEVAHPSFFAKILGEDTLSASATAAAGCFTYGPSVVLPVAFPCEVPDSVNPVTYGNDLGYSITVGGTVINNGTEEYVLGKEGGCNYAMLDWKYFDWIATTHCGAFGSANPLKQGVDPTPAQAECINDHLFEVHPELIYVVVNETKFCAKDPENYDPNNELICELTGGRTQLNSSARGWLNLSEQNGNVAVFRQWISGEIKLQLRTHLWLGFMPGAFSKPGFEAMETRVFEMVWIPVFNGVCTTDGDAEYPMAGKYPTSTDQCWINAHYSPFEDPGNCTAYEVNDASAWAHVIGYAPYFATCSRVNAKDVQQLKNIEDLEDTTFDCPGFEMAVSYTEETEDGVVYPNFEALKDVNYSFEGYFIDPSYLDDPENINLDAIDFSIYTVSLTR